MVATTNNNWTGKKFPIRPADLKELSAGALKIVIARWMQPDATQAEIADMTGYTPRQVRNLTRELDERQPVAELPKPDLSPEQNAARRTLIDFGFDHATASRLAGRFSRSMIQNGLTYIGSSRGIQNERGALIHWLRENARFDREYEKEIFTDSNSFQYDDDPNLTLQRVQESHRRDAEYQPRSSRK